MSLQQGSSGDEVTSLQENLAQVGFANVEADGSYGPITTAAVRAWQRDQEEPETGIASDYDISQVARGAWAGYVVGIETQNYAASLVAKVVPGHIASTYVAPVSSTGPSTTTVLAGISLVGLAAYLLLGKKS
jgi:peptidoglycan hydrolase-like protein with peptidoglycan-binding domain